MYHKICYIQVISLQYSTKLSSNPPPPPSESIRPVRLRFSLSFTLYFSAGPAKIANISVIPITTQRCMSTWEGTLLLEFLRSLFQNNAYIIIVRITPISDTEQPMVDISSKAFLSSLLSLRK